MAEQIDVIPKQPPKHGAVDSLRIRARGSSMDAIGMILWPVGVLLFLEQFRYAILDPHLGWDIQTFRTAAVNLLHHVSPYPVAAQGNPFIFLPSALLMFIPLALVSAKSVTYGYLVAQSAAYILAGFISLRVFGIAWRSTLGAAVLFGIALFEGLEPNIAYSNVQGILVLALACFLYFASRDRWGWAGVALGLSLALKPSFLAVLLVPVLWRQWRCLALSVGIPLGLSLIMLPFLPRIDVLATQVLPYWLHGEANTYPMYNATLYGALPTLHIDTTLTSMVRIVTAGVALTAIIVRFRTKVDERLKIVEIAGMLVLLTLADSSFGWTTYNCLLIPLLVSVVAPESLLRSMLAWAAIYFFAAPTDSVSPFGTGDAGVLHARFALGYLGLLLVMYFRALLLAGGRVGSRATVVPEKFRWNVASPGSFARVRRRRADPM